MLRLNRARVTFKRMFEWFFSRVPKPILILLLPLWLPFIGFFLLLQWRKRLPARFSYTVGGFAAFYFPTAIMFCSLLVNIITWLVLILVLSLSASYLGLTDSSFVSKVEGFSSKNPIVPIAAVVLFYVAVFYIFLASIIMGAWAAIFGFLRLMGLASKVLWPNSINGKIKIHGPVLANSSHDSARNESNPLKPYERIGVILAGGGAKGAYQAGAMKAIYEFLDQHKSLHKVRMIAGRSIGSWKALFWLTDLVKGPHGEAGLLEQWWSQISVQSVIRPVPYLPLRQNFILSNQPWKETFNSFFGDGNPEARDRLLHHIKHPDAEDAIRFYFTRTNVGLARLEFATNRKDLDTGPDDRVHPVKNLDDIRTAVFCSMDIPPLFEYTISTDKQSFYEDGGVVNNLPVRFGTEIEECDLLFILPLNASFVEQVDQYSLTKRVFRVMDIRQGVLERNAFKMIELYNELAGLREKAQEYRQQIERLSGEPQKLGADADHKTKAEHRSAAIALNRKHKVVQVFAICPKPELVINTMEFWKTKEAEHAFQIMYSATRTQLNNHFSDWVHSARVRMALVRPDGDVDPLRWPKAQPNKDVTPLA